MDKLLSYANWLRAEGYQESTIAVTLRHLRTVMVTKVIAACRVSHVQRYLRYSAETRKNPLGPEFLKMALKAGFEASDDRKRPGARVKDTLNDVEWAMLRAKLRRGDEISWMLIAYMQSPYRIGRFLKLRADKVDENDIDDKRSLDWIAEHSNKLCPLYKLLCKTERCAYYRMRRRLLETCKKLGLEADFDTLYKTHSERVRAVEAA